MNIDFKQLVEIRIETNDQGPWIEDAEWVFVMADGSEERIGNEHIKLPDVQWLPGFDNTAVVNAMGCVENETFVVWRRPAATP